MSRLTAVSAVLLLMLVAYAPRQAFADEPTVESVLKKIPLLSPENPELKSFSARVRVQTEAAGVAIIADLAWSREKGCSEIIYNPSSGLPIAYYAEGKMMFYDVIAGTAIVLESTNACVLVQAEDRTLSFNLGFSGDAKDFCLDFPSIFNKLGDRAVDTTLEQKDGEWQLTKSSKSSKSRIVALVSPERDFPLNRLSLVSKDGNSNAFTISNIAVNEENVPSRKFPALDQFPPELKVDRFTKKDGENFFNSIGFLAKWMRVVYGHAALANPELRDIPFGGFVDWEQAAKAEQTIGPAFRKLLDFEKEPMMANASEAGKPN